MIVILKNGESKRAMRKMRSLLPAKNGEGDREHEGLNADPGAESVESSVIGVPIPRLRDRKPSVLRVELRHLYRLPHRAPQGCEEAPVPVVSSSSSSSVVPLVVVVIIRRCGLEGDEQRLPRQRRRVVLRLHRGDRNGRHRRHGRIILYHLLHFRSLFCALCLPLHTLLLGVLMVGFIVFSCMSS